VKVNKMCGYRGFKVISDERVHSDGRYLVNFGPLKLIFGPVERGDQGLSSEPVFSIIGPKFAFLELWKTRLKIEKGTPSLTGRRSQPRSIARPSFLLLD
jgi:hypothetical protein